MNLSLALYSPPHGVRSWRAMIDLTADLGLHRLELLNAFELAQPDPAAAEELLRHARRRGVSFPCLSVFADLMGEESALPQLKQYVDLAGEMEIPLFHHTLVGSRTHADIAAHYEDYFFVAVESARELFDYAAAKGVRTVYEPQSYLLNGSRAIARFLEVVDRPVGLIADLANPLFMEETAEPLLRRWGERVVHVHLKDMKRLPKGEPARYCSVNGYGLEPCPWGEGDAEGSAALSLLQEFSYHGCYSVEINAQNPEELKDMIRKITEAKEKNHAF